MHPEDTIPFGYCQCGCGQRTALATLTDRKWGRVKGQPVRFLPGHNARLMRRINYVIDEATGCWVWQGKKHSHGYGQMMRESRWVLAHRYIYEQRYGTLPEDAVLHHTCHNKSCVNPEHLRVMTQRDHMTLHNEEWRSSRD